MNNNKIITKHGVPIHIRDFEHKNTNFKKESFVFLCRDCVNIAFYVNIIIIHTVKMHRYKIEDKLCF